MKSKSPFLGLWKLIHSFPKKEYFLVQFLANCKLNNRSEETIKNYKCDLLRFFTFLDDEKIDFASIGPATITTYQAHLQEGASTLGHNRSMKSGLLSRFFAPKKTEVPQIQRYYPPLSVASRRRHLSTLKNFFDFIQQKYAEKWQLFSVNPVRPKLHGIKLKDIDQDPTKLLTPRDWEALNKVVVRLQDQLMLNLLYYGGFRLAELTRLRDRDFDEENKCVVFSRKGGSVHRLKIQNATHIFRLLENHMYSRKSEFLFSDKLGNRLSSKTLFNRTKRLIKLANCPTEGLGPHSFRKACATNLYKKTKDLLLVRDYLNHADAKVTQTYIQL